MKNYLENSKRKIIIMVNSTSTESIKSVVSMNEGDAFSSSDGTIIPGVDTSFHIEADTLALFSIIEKERKGGRSQNIMLKGPSGCGKTSTAEQYAARHGLPMLKINCALVESAAEWFGRLGTTRSGGMRDIGYIDTPFTRVVEKGNAVILLDEINRTGKEVVNGLMNLLDHTRAAFLMERRPNPVLKDGGGIVWFATLNEGRAYVGTSRMDYALTTRFSDIVEVNYLPRKEETDLLVLKTGVDVSVATKLVDLANTIRMKSKGVESIFSAALGTRELITAASRYASGGVSTLRFTIVNRFGNDGGADSERGQVLEMMKGKFGALDCTAATTASDLLSL